MPILLRKFSRFGEIIGNLLEFPHEAVSCEPSISLSGNHVVSITACGVVSELSPSSVVIDFSRYSLKISGDALNAEDFSGGDITVTGMIFGIEFCPYKD